MLSIWFQIFRVNFQLNVRKPSSEFSRNESGLLQKSVLTYCHIFYFWIVAGEYATTIFWCLISSTFELYLQIFQFQNFSTTNIFTHVNN